MFAVRVEDDLTALEVDPDGGLSLSYPSPGASPRPRPAAQTALDAWIEFESGEVGFTAPADRTAGAELLAWLRSEVDGELLDRLYEEWLRAKAWKRRDQPDRQALRALEPSDMAYWQEVFPDARPDVYLLRDGAFTVWDAHCITPGCACTESRLMVLEGEDRELREAGSVSVDFKRGATVAFEATTVSKAVLRRVWRAYAGRHQVAQRLRSRKRRLTELCQKVGRRSAAAPAPRTVTKTGRNQPCPCGSGKKYKRCCGRPGR